VVLEVRRQSGANTVAVIEDAKRSSPSPPGAARGVGLTVVQDQSGISTPPPRDQHAPDLGSILASLVVLAFMRSWRSTVIAAVAIRRRDLHLRDDVVLDFTLNSVTMLALVLMVGS